MKGALIAFEGLDQSGKQTQAEGVRDEVIARGRECRLLSFPDYTTPIGSEIGKALHGERDYGADVMQLLYVANRHEQRAEMISAARTKAWSSSATATLPRASRTAKRRGSIRPGLPTSRSSCPDPT